MYIVLLDKKFCNISKKRIDVSDLHNQSAIDLDSFQKIYKVMKENKLKPFENYEGMTMLLSF